MYTYNDIEEVRDFIQGMTYSVKETTEEQIKSGETEIPNTAIFLLKRPNENGGSDYGMGGGPIPSDPIGKIIHNQVVPEIIKQQGNEILCKCETEFKNGVMTLKIEDYVNDTKHEEVFNFDTPKQTTDNVFVTFGNFTISKN